MIMTWSSLVTCIGLIELWSSCYLVCLSSLVTCISLFVFLRNRFDRGWRKIEAFVGSKTVIQVYTCALLT